MQAFTIRDLRERTGELVRDAEAGKLSIVTKHGTPIFVALPFDDAILTGGVKRALALRLVAEGAVSQGKGAELAGMGRVEFLDLMAAHGVLAVDYDVEEFRRELQDLEKLG